MEVFLLCILSTPYFDIGYVENYKIKIFFIEILMGAVMASFFSYLKFQEIKIFLKKLPLFL